MSNLNTNYVPSNIKLSLAKFSLHGNIESYMHVGMSFFTAHYKPDYSTKMTHSVVLARSVLTELTIPVMDVMRANTKKRTQVNTK